MKFKVKITQDVYEATKRCGAPGTAKPIDQGCLFAHCYNELVPNVSVTSELVFFDGNNGECISRINHHLEKEITAFDKGGLKSRKKFIGKEYEFEIPDKVISYWHGDSVKAVQKLINEGNKILQPII